MLFHDIFMTTMFFNILHIYRGEFIWNIAS